MHNGPMVNAIDPYWGSLHCVRSLIVPLLTQLYKWILFTLQGKGGYVAEVTSIGELLNFFYIRPLCIKAIENSP